MKTIKILLSFFIAISIAAGSCLVFATEETTPIDNLLIDKLELIEAIKLAEFEESELSSPITRGKFYKMVCILMGYPAMEASDIVFSDVDLKSEEAGYINALSKIGMITAAGGKIYPEMPIKYSDAVKLLVNALGYAPLAKRKGYEYVINKTKLNKDITGDTSKDLTVGDAVIMVYNSLFIEPMVKKLTTSPSNSEYEIAENTNYLEMNFGVHVTEGIVTGVDITRIQGDNDVTPYHIEIDGLSLDIGFLNNPYDYLGYEVKAYWKDIDDFEPTLLYIEKMVSNNVVEFNVDDVVEITDSNIKVYDAVDKKRKSYGIRRAIPVIYNGVTTDRVLTLNMLSDSMGNIRLVDNNGDRTYDIIFADVYDNYVVSHMDNGVKVMYDKFDSSKFIALDDTLDNPFVKVYDPSGKEVAPTKIKKGNIVSVYNSDDLYQTYVRAYISDTVIKGTIDELDLSNKIMTVDESEYKIPSSVISKLSHLLHPGTDVKLYIDVRGQVAYIEPSQTGEMKYAYIIDAAGKNGLKGQIEFLIYNTNDEFLILDSAKKIRIDGKLYKNNDQSIFSYLEKVSKAMFGSTTPGGSKSSVVKFSLNSDGEIDCIDTVLNGETELLSTRNSKHTPKDCLIGIHSNQKDVNYRKYRRDGSTHIIGPDIAFASSALSFFIPSVLEDERDEKKYYTGTASSLLVNSRAYDNVWAFSTNSSKAVSEFITVFDVEPRGGLADRTALSIIEGCFKICDHESGSTKDGIKIFTKDGTLKLKASETCTISAVASESDTSITTNMKPEDLKKGDVVSYVTNYKGEVTSIVLYYRSQSSSVANNLSTTRWASRTVRYGRVYDTFDDGFLVYYGKKDLASITEDDCELVLTAYAGTIFLKYTEEDYAENECSTSQLQNVKGYVKTGPEASNVIVHGYYGVPQSIVIVE